MQRLAGLLLTTFIFIACTNGGLNSQAAATSSKLHGASSATAANLTAALISITSVVRDQYNPNGLIDIIGDNSGAMGTYCTATSGSGNTGPSSCVCNYQFTVPNTTTSETITVPTTYQDANLLKCSITSSSLPDGLSSMNVSVTVTTQSNNTSASYTLNLNSGSSGLSTSALTTYSQVIRYTCRDTPFVPNVLDTVSGVYDPLQSEAPVTSYPLDFYATNLGLALNAYAGSNGPADWECPSNPLSPPTAFHITIYSQTALNGSKVISGRSGGVTADMNTLNPRSTFYLSNAPTGVFDIPVNAYVAPTLNSYDLRADGSVQGGIPPIGYGAAPIEGSTAGTESCPSNVAIPSGYTWVKVWLFRAALPKRVYLSSTKLQNLGAIACNPGTYPLYSSSAQYSEPALDLPFSDCYNDGTPGGATTADIAGHTLTNPNTNGMASRYLEGTAMCVDVNAAGSSVISGGSAVLSSPYSGFNPTPAIGADTWTPVANAYAGGHYTEGYGPYSCIDSKTSATGAGLSDPVGLCTSANDDLPTDSSPTVSTLDANQRFDFLFVTTPPSVMTRDMSNASGAIYQQYAPYRFRSDTDCNSDNPDDGTCNTSAAFTMYGIKFYDVGSAGDEPSSGGAESFPICALQPTS